MTPTQDDEFDKLVELLQELPSQDRVSPSARDVADDEENYSLDLLHARCQSLLEMQLAVRALHRQTIKLENDVANAYQGQATVKQDEHQRRLKVEASSFDDFFASAHDQVVAGFDDEWQHASSTFVSRSPPPRSEPDVRASRLVSLINDLTIDPYSLGAGIAMLEGAQLYQLVGQSTEAADSIPIQVLVDTVTAVRGTSAVISLATGALETSVRELVGRESCLEADPDRMRQSDLERMLQKLLDILDQMPVALPLDEQLSCEQVDTHIRGSLWRRQRSCKKKPRPVSKDFSRDRPKTRRPSTSPILDTLSALSTSPFTAAAQVSEFVRSGSTVDSPPPVPPKPVVFSPMVDVVPQADSEEDVIRTLDLLAKSPPRTLAEFVVRKLLSTSFAPDCTSSDGPALHEKAKDVCIKNWWSRVALLRIVSNAAFGSFRSSPATASAVVLHDVRSSFGPSGYHLLETQLDQHALAYHDNANHNLVADFVDELRHAFSTVLPPTSSDTASSPSSAAHALLHTWTHWREDLHLSHETDDVRAFRIPATRASILAKHVAPIIRRDCSVGSELITEGWPLQALMYAVSDHRTNKVVVTTDLSSCIESGGLIDEYTTDPSTLRTFSTIGSSISCRSSPTSELLQTPPDCTSLDYAIKQPSAASQHHLCDSEHQAVTTGLFKLVTSSARGLSSRGSAVSGDDWLIEEYERARHHAFSTGQIALSVELANARQTLSAAQCRGVDLAQVVRDVAEPFAKTLFGLASVRLARPEELALSRAESIETYWNNLVVSFIDSVWADSGSSSDAYIECNSTLSDDVESAIQSLVNKFSFHPKLTSRLDALLELELVLSALSASPSLASSLNIHDDRPVSPHVVKQPIGLGIFGLEDDTDTRVPLLSTKSECLLRVRTDAIRESMAVPSFRAFSQPLSTDSLLALLETVVTSHLISIYPTTLSSLSPKTPRQRLNDMLESAQIMSTLLGENTTILDRGVKAKAFCDMVCVLTSLKDKF
ncbi:hypothetical protein ACM66B_004782 [Microbotryomycetes sp. NB124-2]